MAEVVNDDLLTALVGPDWHRKDLYHNNASFHHAIDLLAGMLPVWVDGLAANAESVAADIRARIETAMKTTPTFWVGPNGRAIFDPGEP